MKEIKFWPVNDKKGNYLLETYWAPPPTEQWNQMMWAKQIIYGLIWLMDQKLSPYPLKNIP